MTVIRTAHIDITTFITDGDWCLMLQETYLYDIPDGEWLELIGIKWALAGE